MIFNNIVKSQKRYMPLLASLLVTVYMLIVFSCIHVGFQPQETVNTGFFHMRSTCRRCGGQGHIISTPCKKCHGKGRVTETKTVTIPVPAGAVQAVLSL